MKKVFTIFIIESKDIHVPSTDYYARNNEPSTDTVMLMRYWNHKDTEEEAMKYLEENISDSKEEFVILPTYTKK